MISTTQHLVSGALSGDQTAWTSIYRKYYAQLYAIALRHCGNKEFVKDLVHDSFLQAFLNLEKLKEPEALPSWLTRILINRCYHFRSKSLQHISIDEVEDYIADGDEGRLLIESQNQIITNEAIGSLPEKLRVVVMLRYFTRFESYRTIADVLAIPIGTVRS
jgi:RNA polymerase sigma-70 factor (ECF subfamily)